MIFFSSLFVSCKRETVEEKVTADFTYQVADSNYTIPARILFTNKSTGAQQYKWTFEGASIPGYDQKEPGVVTFTTPGTIQIKLEAWKDQLRSEKIITIVIDSVPHAAFTAQPMINNFGVTDFSIINQSAGGLTEFNWTFDGGTPSSFSGVIPPTVKYAAPGQYRIFLEASNSRGRKDTLSQYITVMPVLTAGFDIIPSFDDEDYEAPLTATLQNNSVSVTAHAWSAPGGTVSNSSDSIPTVMYNLPGTYTITYKATNGKDSATVTKTIVVKPNTGLRTFTAVQLGINTAQATIGSCFSTRLRKVIKQADITADNGNKIDLPFYGLSQSFNYNLFVSPAEIPSFALAPIPGATATQFINSQELCTCGIHFTATDFDNIINGNAFNSLQLNFTTAGAMQFDNSMVPRIILFQNAAMKKGAIKIRQFVQDGEQSYIICDIKVQKD